MKIKKEKFFILSLLWSLIVSILFYLVFYSVLSNKIDNLIKQAANTIYNFGIYLSVIIVFSTFIIGFILHELIHAVFCILFTKNINSITFGIDIKQMILYCHCKEPLYVNHYLIMVIAPFIIMGLFPFIIGLCFENIFFLIFGYIFSIAAVGDLLIISLIIKNYQKKFIKDSETEIGGEYID